LNELFKKKTVMDFSHGWFNNFEVGRGPKLLASEKKSY